MPADVFVASSVSTDPSTPASFSPGGHAPSTGAEVADDGGEAAAVDELHGVVVNAVVAAHAEDRDNMRVVELGGRVGLDLEPLAVLGVDGGGEREGLQGDSPAERKLLGLVDDAHPTSSDLAQNVVVAELGLWRQSWLGPLRRRVLG